MRRGFANRVDASAKDLIAYAKSLGAQFAAADGTYDGVLWMPAQGRIEMIDWKSKGGNLTPAQVKLVASGWPLRFVSSPELLQALVQR